MSQTMRLPPVLSLEETARYLRVPPAVVKRQADQGHIPGQCIEMTWRFLKTALDEWLRSQGSRSSLLPQVGTLGDEDTLPALRSTLDALDAPDPQKQQKLALPMRNKKKQPIPVWERFEDASRSLPEEELSTLPPDGASEHDHYLYGTPKRST